MPTVQGIFRRGLQLAALREFIIGQGSSKNTNLLVGGPLRHQRRNTRSSQPLHTISPIQLGKPVHKAPVTHYLNNRGSNTSLALLP